MNTASAPWNTATSLGAHGLPLMGTGDWNDGMNKVGAQGKGESVWNGWFFITVLNAFAELAGRRGDAARVAWCQERAEGLRAALEAHAWDGAWYRRAYFDDGTPLGSAQNDECQIDAIPQAWAVISGAADPARAEQAMASVDERLVHTDSKLIQLFDPPFDRGATAARLHQGLRAGNSRERRPVHPRGHLGRTGDGTARPRRSCAGAVEPDQPGLPRHHARGGAALQGRALRGLCRHLRRSAAHRPRRLDVVHWLGGLAVPRRRWKRSSVSVRPATLLRVEPCIPCGWPGYEVAYRHGTATYRIRVENLTGAGRGVRSVLVDGQAVPGGVVPLRDDGREHDVRVAMGSETT